MNNPSKFNDYFKKVLREHMTAGSVSMGATGTQFSGDTYATGDARMMPHFQPNTRLKEGKKKTGKKKKSHSHKWDSRSGKYYKPKTVSEGKKKAGQTKARKCPQGFMGSASQPHSTKKGKKGYTRRSKHQDGKLYDSNVPMIRRSKIAM